MAKFRMRPVKAVALRDAFRGFQEAHRALRGGQPHAELSVDMPDDVEAEQVPVDGLVPTTDQMRASFLAWAQGQGIASPVFDDHGTFTGGGVTAAPGQWVVIGPNGPYVLTHAVVVDNLQRV